MASYNVAPLEELVDQFARLPGIGKKTAQRLSFFVLGLPEGEAEKFADAIVEAHKKIHSCKICQNLTDGETCSVSSLLIKTLG